MNRQQEDEDRMNKPDGAKHKLFIAREATIANKLLIAGAVASLLVFCYFFYQYSLFGNMEFAHRMRVITYCIIPLLAAVLLFAALKLKPAYKINLILAGFAVIFSVYAIELYLQITYSPILGSGTPVMGALQQSKDKEKQAAELARRFGVRIDTRSRREVIADLRRKGIEAVPSVIPRYQLKFESEEMKGRNENKGKEQLIALGGISNKVTVLCNESGQHSIYESDEHGFNNPKGLWNTSPVDVVAVGDSFTQGYCVPSDKNFVALIRQRYPATLNLGIAGDGPLLMLATIKEYASQVKPRLVLWFYFEGNDLLDLQNASRSGLLMHYLKDGFSQNLIERQEESDRAIESYIEKEAVANAEETKREEVKAAQESKIKKIKDRAVGFVKLDYLRTRLGLAYGEVKENQEVLSVIENNMGLYREILTQAKTIVSSWGGRLCFVYLPNYTRYDSKISGGSPINLNHWELGSFAAERMRTQVMKINGDLGIPSIDMIPAFNASGDPMSLFPFHAPGHYNEAGHRLVAEEILKALASGKPDGTP